MNEWATSPIRRPRRVWYGDGAHVVLDIAGEGAKPYLMRGGICWPYARLGALACDSVGYAVVLAQDRDGRVTVLEYCGVESVRTRLGKDGLPVQYGVGAWLMEQWARYLLRRYYLCQTDTIQYDFLREVLREPTIDPKPAFLETRERIESDAPILALRARGALRATRDFIERLDAASARVGMLDPCQHALSCALAGLSMVSRL